MMKEYKMKETYERSSLTVTEFSEEDVIVTSGEFSLFSILRGDNDSKMMFQDKG